jgi:hypothetical protein
MHALRTSIYSPRWDAAAISVTKWVKSVGYYTLYREDVQTPGRDDVIKVAE